MSNRDREQRNTLAAFGYARRRFLGRTALATAGVSAAAVLVAANAATSDDEAPPAKCSDAKAPMKDVEGKVAFITGGSSGIGLGIARAFVEGGMKVAFTYRTESHLDEAMQFFDSAGDRVHAIKVDVTDRPGLEQAAAETVKIFGKVHALVNNAGVVLPPALSATNYSDWDWLLNVNLNGPFNGVRVFLPLIRAHGEGGQIITTSSTLGLFAISAAGAYTVSKYAVLGMMEALRAEFSGTNIGTSVFCPGFVRSRILETSLRDRPAENASKDDAQALKADIQARNNPELAMDPLVAGRIVLRGMRNNDLYILSHAGYETIIRDRNEALMTSIPTNPQTTGQPVERRGKLPATSIYSIERDRRRCAD